MNSATSPTLVAIVVQLALGLAVFQATPHRKSNQSFLIVSLALATWLACIYAIFVSTEVHAAAFYIRQVSAMGAISLFAFNLLRISIKQPNGTWKSIVGNCRGWTISTVVMVVICQTSFFLKDASHYRPDGSTSIAPIPNYGPGAFFLSLFMMGGGILLVGSFIRDVRRAHGREQAEMNFVLIGTVVLLGLTLLGFSLRHQFHQTILNWLAPFRIVVFSFIIAYGITTRKIMEAGVFLRRSIAYVLLTTYLLALYGVVWWLGWWVALPILGESAVGICHMAAAVVVAFAMAPARGISQTLADRLFGGSQRLDFHATMNRAAAILRSVITLNEMLEKFAATIGEAVNAERVCFLLPDRDGYVQKYPPVLGAAKGISLPSNNELVQHLEKHQEPLVFEELVRLRLSPATDSIASHMEAHHVAIAVAISSREHLAGIMLLGPRLSGRVYGSVEQDALQVLGGQLAVAVENAQLFTEVQNAKLYNETLLENLTSGVIAVGADERVTVFNNEAGQITGLNPQEVIDQPIETLPASIRDALRDTLHSVDRQENKEIALQSDEAVVARASSAIFHGQEGEMLGALMVLTDITALKRLERQIRRSDRLASLGTLSAGMAHEIKNPLVSIKTFAQLLPERYQDSDFRETFSNLIGHEIDRIDSLVNQLLRFARPAKPLLKPMHVHDVLEKSLMLVGHRLYQKEIKLSRSWNAEVDTIHADADQLEQVFLNFFLNAMDAMKLDGELNVSTEIRSADDWISSVTSDGAAVREILCVTVQDNGEGIKNEDIAHVFDPFFTTKDYGTGLGLSVVHGIIQEHGGEIEVVSELAKGTSFHILLPLVRFQEEVAAA